MALMFDPWEEHGIKEQKIRLVIKDFDSGTFYKIIEIDEKFSLNDKKIEENLWRYKYK